MTDEEKLKELGLSQEDIDEMREDGSKVAMEFDVKAAREIALRYFEIGMDDKGFELLDAADSNANYWSTKVYEVTGKDIYFSEASNRWHDGVSGQFVKNPYIDIRVDNYELEQSLINKYL